MTQRCKQTKLDNYWLSAPIETSNRFERLEQESDDEDQGNKSSYKDKIAKPPPIFVDGVGNIQPLIHLLNEIAPNSYAIKILSNDQGYNQVLPNTLQL